MENKNQTGRWLILLWGVFAAYMLLYIADLSLYEYAQKQSGEGGLVYLLSFLFHLLAYPVLLCSLVVFALIGAFGKRPIGPVLQVVLLIVLFDGVKVAHYNGGHPFYSIVLGLLAEPYHRYQADRDPPFSDTDIYNPEDAPLATRPVALRPLIRNRTVPDELWKAIYGDPFLSLTFLSPRSLNISSRLFSYDRLIGYRLRGRTEVFLFLHQDKLLHCALFPNESDAASPIPTGCIQSGYKEEQTIRREGLAYCFQRNRSFQILHKCAEKSRSLTEP